MGGMEGRGVRWLKTRKDLEQPPIVTTRLQGQGGNQCLWLVIISLLHKIDFLANFSSCTKVFHCLCILIGSVMQYSMYHTVIIFFIILQL